MAGRPAKSLRAHVQDGTFRARRHPHRALLLGPGLQWPAFASLQTRYAQASSEPERRALALEFQQLVQAAQRELHRLSSAGGQGELAARIAADLTKLGKPGSTAQLLGFFPSYLAHPKGPLLGQPFTLEPWQQRFLREFFRRDTSGNRIYRSGVL